MLKKSKLRSLLFILAGLFAVCDITGLTATAATLNPDAINSATPTADSEPNRGLDPMVVKMQILLDRAHFSPGEIDPLLRIMDLARSVP